MLRERVREGVRSGLVAAAATAGVLLGFGIARGAAMRPINSVAHILIGSRAYYMVGVDWRVTPLALLVHVAASCAAGAVLALLTAHLRGRRIVVAAIAYAVALWLVVDFVIPQRVRPGYESGLSRPELLIVYLVMALVLAQMIAWERGSAGATNHGSQPPLEPGN